MNSEVVDDQSEDSAAQPTPRYKNPPVIERVIVVEANMSPEQFEIGLEAWREQVIKEYPCEEPLTEWLLNMEERDGIPLLDTMQPELKITHRFSKKRSVDGFDWSIRCPVGKLVMNMHSKPGCGRSFSDLFTEFQRWLPIWMSHFGVTEVRSVGLAYVNKLRRDITPSLFDVDGGLELGKALTVFSSVPGQHERLEPPFDCRVGVRLSPQAKLSIRVHDASQPPHGVTVKVVLNCEAGFASGSGGLSESLRLLDWCHERIIERFELVFTAEAKETFLPTPP